MGSEDLAAKIEVGEEEDTPPEQDDAGAGGREDPDLLMHDELRAQFPMTFGALCMI